ncbi:Cro/CI family transcriptional regulator [Marinomonas sp.]|uniref:Cro/CI family transcriptional regulator n=1 Tax=Marinomonas sp. TaxID=1904862 RepID=UPI003F9AFB94
MNKNAVIDFFGGNQSEVSRALGISRSYVSAWPELVPELQAMKLERLTDGALQYDASLYSCQHKQTA